MTNEEIKIRIDDNFDHNYFLLAYDTNIVKMLYKIFDIIPEPPYDREEYLTIAKGEWLPKKGDICYSVSKSKMSVTPIHGGELTDETILAHCLGGFAFFPSLKQADEYISKHKKSGRFVKGDFYQQTDGQYTIVGAKNDGYYQWYKSFCFLAFHALELGGVVGGKPNDKRTYYHPDFGNIGDGYRWRVDNWVANLSKGYFWFQDLNTARNFLSTDGVKDALTKFYFLEDK